MAGSPTTRHAAIARRFAAVACAWLLATRCGPAPAPPPTPAPPTPRPHRPNVVLITLDTTRADHLGCYGYSNAISPHLDRFAREAVLFDHALGSAAVTPVSHASIFTGLYPYTHGLRGFAVTHPEPLAATVPTLPTILKTQGYHTAAFISAITAGHRYGLDRGFDRFDEDFSLPQRDIVVPDGQIYWANTQRNASETTDRVLAWLATAPAPYLLWVHYFDPHDPVVLPPPAYRRQHPVPAGSQRDQLRATYDLELQFMDLHLGRLLDALRQSPDWDRTIVVIVADHGEGLGDHRWWTHGILYQEQLRPALLIKAPGLAGGQRLAPLVRTIDLLPTILELAGLDPQAAVPVEGRSLVPLLRGQVTDPGLIAYAEAAELGTYPFAPGITDVKDDLLFSVTDGRWKYIAHHLRPGESELYDLVEDPRERRNRYADRPAERQRLEADLQARPFRPAPAATTPASAISPAEIERLRSLGYIR